MSKTLNLSKDFLNRFRATGTNELLDFSLTYQAYENPIERPCII